MSIAVTIVAGSKRVFRTDQGAPIRKETLSITGLTAGADNTCPHGLPFTPNKLSYRPTKGGTTPGGWTETQVPDATNIYITVNANGSTAGLVDIEEQVASYCKIDDVVSAYRFFQRNVPNSPSDTDISGWIDDRKARIRATLLRRGLDPDNPPAALTTDQQNFLRSLNRDGAIADLGNSLQGTLTLQPGEISLASSHRKTYETVLADIAKGNYDAFFGLKPLFGGIAGAETDPAQTPASMSQNRFFGRSQVF